MNRATRLLVNGLTVAACLWPLAGSAMAQDAMLTVEQADSVFTIAGYTVDKAQNWSWTSPPVTSFHVHDLSSGRVTLVLVYPSAAAAHAGRLQAETQDRALNLGTLVSSPGPHLVPGYGPSIWSGNVAMVQTTQDQLERLYRAQSDRENGVYVDADLVQNLSLANFPVDLDFQQALENGIVNHL
jgi:hypothetical protein